MPRPFRFGVQLARASSRRAWLDKARRAEGLGYSTVFMPDHFADQLAPVPALMAVADATSLRIGTLVLSNDYRHPLVLAREAATLDLLSEGRLELGVGAGWLRADYDAAGITYDPPGVRVERLAEAVTVLKELLGGGTVTFEGRHYRISSHRLSPRPVQQPRPPLLVGGGSRRILALAGREADIVGVNFDLRAGEVSAALAAGGTAEATERRLAWVREGAGERFAGLELTVNLAAAAVTPARAAVVETMAPTFGITAEAALAMPQVLIGTVDEMVEDLRARRDRFGFSYITVPADVVDELGPVVSRLAGT